jgi:Flp pilus assembly protein TadB
MKRKRNAADARRRRKMFTILWTALLAIITILLLYWEMTALLYILATLGVTALLVVVALADLSYSENMSDEPQRLDDSAAIASGITRQT